MHIQCPNAWPAILCAVLLAACSRTPPEQRLRESVDAMQAAIEAREVSGVRERLAEDFIGPGGMDRRGAARLAQATFMRHRNIGIAIVGPLDLSLQDTRASVRFDAALSGGSGGLLPDDARIYSVETGWRLEGDEWRLVSATWKPRL
ncbi:MAG: nuclear transport factor 2 family protein [Pseudomonadota bacterium]|nr:nuclear transport factor 2 family protein [Pseudomonadota bacterium]